MGGYAFRSIRMQLIAVGLIPSAIAIVLTLDMLLAYTALEQRVVVAGTIAGCLVTVGLTFGLGVRLARRMRDDEAAEIDQAFAALSLAARKRESDLARYHLLSETAQDGIVFVHDVSDEIVEVNAAAAQMFGYLREEMIGMPASRLRGAGQAAFQGEGFIIRSDGARVPVEVRTALSNVDAIPLRLSIVRDISERRRNEEVVRNALSQAVDASRVKSEFVSTMSHELRTPMNAVIGMSELLLETPLSPEQEEYVRVLRSSGQSLLAIINDILDFSKIEAGRMELSFDEFRLMTVVEDVGGIVGSAARAKSLELMTFVDPRIPATLLGDGDRLRQILVNLVSNAVKFTELGAVKVWAELVRWEGDEVTISFEVRDTGIGMTSAELQRLFEAFRQADGSKARRFGGAGLGLVISQRLVRLMGGEIRAESTQGAGSRFYFDLKFRPGTSKESARPRSLDELSVLVADDDFSACSILSRYLTSWKIEHHCVSNQAAALESIREAHERQRPFSCVLIDLRLGNDDGFELGRILREEFPERCPALVMITAHDAPDQGRRAIMAGFVAYLLKPIRQSQLFDVLAGIASGEAGRPIGAAQSAQTPHGEEAEDVHILVAEDNEVNQALATRQLRVLGYQNVTIAKDGEEALAVLASARVDLIFMDVHMPNLDGFQTTRYIRQSESTGVRVPIVAMTANALEQDRDECLAAGMDDHIGKPVTLATLREKIANWLPAGTPARAMPILDRARLLDLFGGDTRAAREVLMLSASSLGELVEQLALASGVQASDIAHNIKGAAANIGAAELSECARVIEMACKSTGSPPAAEIDELRAVYQRFCQAVGEMEGLT